MGKWLELLGRLGRALLDLLSAELTAFADDLRGTGRDLFRSLILLACAAGLALLSGSLLTLALVWALSQVMASWQAALVVAVAYGLAAVGLGLAARRRLSDLEMPIDTLIRHWDDQRDWFQDRVFDSPADPAGSGGEEEL